MFNFLLDVVAGFLIAKRIKRIWVQNTLAIAAGIANSIVGNMLMYGAFTPGEIMILIVVGFILDPLITLSALWILS